MSGLIIGYEHTFVHAIADFLIECGNRHPGRADLPHRAPDHKVCDAIPVGQDRPVGRSGCQRLNENVGAIYR